MMFYVGFGIIVLMMLRSSGRSLADERRDAQKRGDAR